MQELIGDALVLPEGDKPVIIAHVVNDVRAWGAGFVLPLGRAYPAARAHYLNPAFPLRLGTCGFVEIEGTRVTVANMVAQHGLPGRHNPNPLDYDSLEQCLFSVQRRALQYGADVQMPKIGCGLARGNWNLVSAIIFRAFFDFPHAVRVFTLKN